MDYLPVWLYGQDLESAFAGRKKVHLNTWNQCVVYKTGGVKFLYLKL